MNKFNPIAVYHSQKSRISQEPISPLPMLFEETKKTTPFRHPREKIEPVVDDLSIKGSVSNSLDSKQNSYPDNLTGGYIFD
jgi:hypothetical protein